MARICWRSDGEYFILHFIDIISNCRKFQVFSRDGILHSTIEKQISILDAPISWKYSKSQLIAASVYRFNKHEIIFFERNGLIHGGFTLPFEFNKMRVNEILWNLNSTILCVWSELITENENSENQSVIQLWSTCNFHWYLKQSYNFELSNKISSVSWDPEDSFALHLFTIKGQYLNYKLGSTINVSNATQNYNGAVAVTDFNNILITQFKNKIIPPPLSQYKLNCSSSINKIIWSQTNQNVLAYLMDGNILYFKYQLVKETFEYVLIGKNKFEIEGLKNYNVSSHHVYWIYENELLVIADTNCGFKMFSFEIIHNNHNTISFSKKIEQHLNHDVYNLTFNPKSNHLIIQDTNSQIYKYKLNQIWQLIDDNFKFPQLCIQISAVTILCKQVEQEIIFGLSKFYRLYVDKFELTNNCSSFYVHDEYLLFTDHSNTLKFYDLNDLNNLSVKKVKEESMRSIEKGSRIVLVEYSDTKCILQTPRGNLETIHPRALVISRLKNNIDNLRYLKAIEMMRKHRVNMNILFDHNPESFLTNINIFVDQVDDPTLINLFITELSEENTKTTFYKDFYSKRDLSKIETLTNCSTPGKQYNEIKTCKIKLVCEQLIDACEKKDSIKYFLVILSCLVKMKEIEKGLHRIILSKSIFLFFRNNFNLV